MSVSDVPILTSKKKKVGCKGTDHYGRTAIVKMVQKEDIHHRRLEDLKNIHSDFIVSFFGLTENDEKKAYALFMEPCLISMELYLLYKRDPSTTAIGEEVKERVRAHEQARELMLDFVDISLDIIKGIAFLHESGRFHGNLSPSNVLLKPGERRWHAKLELNVTRNKGSLGWRSVKFVTGTDPSPTRADGFSLALLLFHLFSSGRHAYPGSDLESSENAIRENRQVRYYLLPLAVRKGLKQVIGDLLAGRITPTDAQNFPFFWSGEKSIQFLIEVVDTLNEERRLNKRILDGVATRLGWWRKMTTEMKEFFDDSEYCPGEGLPVAGYELLRFVRNTTTHYRTSQNRCPNFCRRAKLFPTKAVAHGLHLLSFPHLKYEVFHAVRLYPALYNHPNLEKYMVQV